MAIEMELQEPINVVIRCNDCDDGYAIYRTKTIVKKSSAMFRDILVKGLLGYVYPDGFGGYRPYGLNGKVLNAGLKAKRSPKIAACYFVNDPARNLRAD